MAKGADLSYTTFSPWKFGDKSDLFLVDVEEIKHAWEWLNDAFEHEHDLDVAIQDIQAESGFSVAA